MKTRCSELKPSFEVSSPRRLKPKGVGVETRMLARFEPVEFDEQVIDIVERSAAVLGLSSRRMPSGAGHDAQMFARSAQRQ